MTTGSNAVRQRACLPGGTGQGTPPSAVVPRRGLRPITGSRLARSGPGFGAGGRWQLAQDCEPASPAGPTAGPKTPRAPRGSRRPWPGPSRLLQVLRQLLPLPARRQVRVHRRRGDHRVPEGLLNVLEIGPVLARPRATSCIAGRQPGSATARCGSRGGPE